MTEITAGFDGDVGVWAISATWHGFRQIELLGVGDSVVGLGKVARIHAHPHGEQPELYEVCFTRDSAVMRAAERAIGARSALELFLSFDRGAVLPVLVPDEEEDESDESDDLARVPDLLQMARESTGDTVPSFPSTFIFAFNRLCDAVEILAAQLPQPVTNPFAELFDDAKDPNRDPQSIPAYDCPGCGQRNSGWSLECGRCGHARPEWATKR